MQSWPNSGQNGADGQDSWQQGFVYTNQDGQFDPNRHWQQSGEDQAADANFFTSAHNDDFVRQGVQPDFQNHGGHASVPLSQQFAHPSHGAIDPAFTSLQPELFAQQQQGRPSHSPPQAHVHAQGHAQSFSPLDFQFSQDGQQQFGNPNAQFPTPQHHARPSSQQQHFESRQHNFVQDQSIQRQLQQSPPAQQQVTFHSQPFPQHGNGQQTQFGADPNARVSYQPDQHQHHLQQHQHSPQALTANQTFHQTNQTPSTNLSPSPSKADNGGLAQPIVSHSSVQPSPAGGEQAYPVKKRKRPTSAASPSGEADTPPIPPVDSVADNSIRRHDELKLLPIPVPTPEEVGLISDSNKRRQSSSAAYPPSQGLPHFAVEGSIRLPAPKSHDKISPLVAPPSHSGRKVAPELGYALPCEVQGVFSSKYRPAPGKGGLDDRRAEAKGLLDDYDRSMRALGKRQPKYTEYPHAFKEQLKADEAWKNKVGKKAKKDLDKPIRPATRPTEPAEAAAWDAIGIVNIDASTARTSALIAGRVQQAGEFFVKLRSEMNRSKLEWEQAVKDKLPEDRIAPLKLEADQKKEAFYRALDATVEHADDAVLDNLGGHQKLILSLVNALIACVKANDFSGKLPKIVLELFTHFRMTKKIVDTTNFDTVRKRFEDKGDDEAKELAREIAAKVKKFLKASEPETATGYTGTSAASRAKAAATKPPTDGASSKRGREDDAENTRTVKKIAVESGASSLSKKLGQAKTATPSGAKPPTVAKPPISSVLPGKSRPVSKIVAKVEEVKADSPGSTSDDKSKVEVKKQAVKADAKPAAKPEPKPVHKAPTSTASSSSALSGIASLLDSINSKKTEAAPATTKEVKPVDNLESADQKSKRLRKEARRKLRVSWKPDQELVEIRVFEKGDEEDEGRDTNMIRDAADDRSEGMMLKQRMDVVDDEDDDDIPYQPWVAPMAVDFSQLPTDIREKSYVTRGGIVEFSTDEQKRIAEREQRELMAIYTDPDDIPPSPKSPLPEAAQPSGDSKSGQLPLDDAKFEEIQHRWRDEQTVGVDQALYAAINRLEGKDNPSNKLNSILGSLKGANQSSSAGGQSSHAVAHQTFPFAAGPAAEEQVHAWLVSERIRSWRDPNPVHVDLSRPYTYAEGGAQMCGGIIEALAKSLAGKPYPATNPPEWLSTDEERVREWWLGYNKEASAKQKKVDEDRARAEAHANAVRMAAAGGQNQDWSTYLQQQSQQQSQSQQDYAPYLALLQQMTGQQVGPGQSQQGQVSSSQLESIMASMSQSQSSQGSNPLANLNPNDPSYQQLLMLTQLTQGQPGSVPPPPPAASSEQRSEHHEWDRHDGRGDYARDSKDGRRKKPTLAPHKPANKALIGTKPCTFWQQGKCARGDQCTFRHD